MECVCFQGGRLQAHGRGRTGHRPAAGHQPGEVGSTALRQALQCSQCALMLDWGGKDFGTPLLPAFPGTGLKWSLCCCYIAWRCLLCLSWCPAAVDRQTLGRGYAAIKAIKRWWPAEVLAAQTCNAARGLQACMGETAKCLCGLQFVAQEYAAIVWACLVL